MISAEVLRELDIFCRIALACLKWAGGWIRPLKGIFESGRARGARGRGRKVTRESRDIVVTVTNYPSINMTPPRTVDRGY
jgi:hypothetical protein